MNFRDYDKRTPAHIAASEGHADVVDFLCAEGAFLNRSDRWGGSPLDDALRHRNADVAALLRALDGAPPPLLEPEGVRGRRALQ